MLRLGQIGLPLLILALLLVACDGAAGATSAVSTEVPTGGARLFVDNGCIACHVVEAGQPEGVGPALYDIAVKGVEIVKSPNYTGQADSVEGYIRESILEPDLYVVDGYDPLMPKTYVSTLSEEDLTEIATYLLELQ